MKNFLSLYMIISLLLSIHQKAYLQKYKYGDVKVDLLTMAECDFYTGAEAMVTYISGDNSVLYSDSEGFYSVRKVKKQVKIFNDRAKDAGTNHVVFYSPKERRGKIKFRGLKGKTYHLENNKIVETKLKGDNIFETQINDYFKRISFSMPNIQKNCVFEFEYELESEYYTNIDDWHIQSEYPVVYNEFYTSTPKYYRYQINVTGGIPVTKDVNNTYDVKLHYKSTTSSGILRSSQFESVDIPFNKRTLIHENIPPLENEPYSINTSDQMAKITHQLILVDWPGEMIRNIAIDYPNFTKSLLDDTNFGNVLKKGDFIKDFVVPIQNEPQLETADKVYKTFIEKVQWDGYHHYRTEMSGKSLFKQGKGDAGDINLNYIAALNEMGIASFPIIMSTRGNGTPHPVYPDFSDFNYVFAVSVIGEKLYFSDATSGLGFGHLPIRCLNGEGWIVSENGADWIKTKKDFSGRHVFLSNISFADNKMNMKSSEARTGYFAFADNEILKDNEADFIKSKYQPDNLILDSMFIVEKKINSIKSQFVSHWDFEDENVKYVYPFELRPFKDNPFKKEKRSTAIDFPFIQEYKLLTYIDISADEVFEVPQNIHAAMGENAIVFKYTSNFNNSLGKLSINIDFKINQTEFLQEEYPELREAFDSIIKKISEPVIIKKKL